MRGQAELTLYFKLATVPIKMGRFVLLSVLYGGYFAAGIGILMLATLGIAGITDITYCEWIVSGYRIAIAPVYIVF